MTLGRRPARLLARAVRRAEDGGQARSRRSSRPVWRLAAAMVWAHRTRLLLGLLLLVLGRIAGLVLPASSKVLVDQVVGEGRADLLVPLAAAIGAAALVQATTSFTLSQLLGVAAQRTITELRRRLHRHLIHLPVARFARDKSGELISRVMNDAEGVQYLVGTGVVQLGGGLVTAALAGSVLLYLDWRLAAAVLGIVVAFLALLLLGLRRIRPLFRERQRIYAELSGRLGESIGGIRVVKAYTAERRESLAFTRGAHHLLRTVARSITGISLLTATASVAFGAAGITIILLGGRAVVDDRMTLGDLVMFVAFTGMLAMPLVQVASVGSYLAQAFAGLDRVDDLLAEEQEDMGPSDAGIQLHGRVEARNLSFHYDSGPPALTDVSFVAESGTTTALVGPSGAGKSTLVALLSGFYRSGSGRLLVDDRDLESLPLRAYRSRIAVVFQDEFLFDGTIAENIAYSRPRSSRHEVENAGRLAHCDEFVAALPAGYDTVIGERGVRLSGGQRQRVAIARALLADPRILLLDEATSSLDSHTEALIRDGLRALRRGRTTFVIAHRLSTIESADQILVLDGGHIVERGTHAELLAAAGLYRQLWERQSGTGDLFLNPGESPREAEQG